MNGPIERGEYTPTNRENRKIIENESTENDLALDTLKLPVFLSTLYNN